MLLKFRIKNYKSYKDLQEFSMIGGGTKRYDERLFNYKEFSVLKFSAIYGANGSGKSNLVDGLHDMQSIIVKGLPDYYSPINFKMDNEFEKQSTYFETFLFIDSKVYSYGFEFNSNDNKILSEWLVLVNKGVEIELLTRDTINCTFYCDKKLNIESGNKLEMYLDDMKEDNTKLFLSFINTNKRSAILNKLKVLSSIYNWFDDNLNIAEPDSMLTSGEYFLIDEKIEQLAQLLYLFDTGIEGIGKVDVSKEIAIQNIPSKYIEKLKSEFNSNPNDGTMKLCGLIKIPSGLWQVVVSNNDINYGKICFYHDKEKKYPFSINEESEGTTRIIELAETLLTKKSNQLFVIDELDRKLHPQLTCKFVQLFLKKCIDNNNQLIVTTHESRLLDFDILRRDEIWFVDKNKCGESKIYSLEDFNVRFDKKIDKAYLDGRYGGVPIFNTIFPFDD